MEERAIEDSEIKTRGDWQRRPLVDDYGDVVGDRRRVKPVAWRS